MSTADLIANTYRPQNKIANAIRKSEFFWTIEFVASSDQMLDDDMVKVDSLVRKLARREEVAGFTVTDRVHSDVDPDPVMMATHVRDHSGTQPLLHWSGKDRDMSDLITSLDQIKEAKLENILILTGDKLKDPPDDRRPRYLESVAAIQIARQHSPDLTIAAALNPFKYREEESVAQYLKLGKKIAAGADYLITQIGFDIVKHEEALFWMDSRGYRVPMVANIMALNAARSRFIRKNQLAGVTITDSYHELLQAEEKEFTKEQTLAKVTNRLALQIVGLRLIGYSGVQLTAINSIETLETLQNQVDSLSKKCHDRITWNKAWEKAFVFPDGKRVADPAPEIAWTLSFREHYESAPLRDRIKYRVMDRVHSFWFDNGLGAKLLAKMFGDIERGSEANQKLEKIEHAIKAPLFGCETCGMCRLAATQYVCPETCPKGLANGPCGGTNLNTCEFGDRECIHTRKYRIARDMKLLSQLEQWLIPSVPKEFRQTSSWPPHLRGEGPEIVKKKSE